MITRGEESNEKNDKTKCLFKKAKEGEDEEEEEEIEEETQQER